MLSEKVFIEKITTDGIKFISDKESIRAQTKDNNSYWEISKENKKFHVKEGGSVRVLFSDNEFEDFYLCSYIYIHKTECFNRFISKILEENDILYEDNCELKDIKKILKYDNITIPSGVKIKLDASKLILINNGSIVLENQCETYSDVLFLMIQWCCYIWYFSGLIEYTDKNIRFLFGVIDF